jgi:deazaflavin-dependent oxidoreductase (nitroreductase family)
MTSSHDELFSLFKRGYLRLLKHTLNPVTERVARSGHGPFSLVRHVGRRTGRVYETPIILASVDDGFVAELTYGTDVSWYKNVLAAGHCVVVVKGVDYPIDRIEPYSVAAGLRAFGFPRALILRVLRRREFRFLHVEQQLRIGRDTR